MLIIDVQYDSMHFGDFGWVGSICFSVLATWLHFMILGLYIIMIKKTMDV